MINNKKISFIIERYCNRPINNNFITSNNKNINFHDNIPFKQKESNNKEKNFFVLKTKVNDNYEKIFANNKNISVDAVHLFYDLIIGKGSYGKVFFRLSIFEKSPVAIKFYLIII